MPRFAFPPLKQVSAVAEAASPPTAISKATSIFEFSQLSEDHESPLTAGYNAASIADAGSDGITRDSQQDEITCRPLVRCSRLLFHSNRTAARRESCRELEPGSSYAFSSTSARLRTASSPTVAEEPPHRPITKRFRQTMLSNSGRIAHADQQVVAASDGWCQIKRARRSRRSVADRRQLRSMLNGVKRLDAATIDRMYTKGDIDILLGPKAFSKKEKKAMSKKELIDVLIRLIHDGSLYTEDENSPPQPRRHETSDEEDEYSSEAEIEDGSEVEDEDFEEETRPRRTTYRTLCADERMHALPNIRLVLRGIRLPTMLQEASAVLPSQPALPSTPSPSIPPAAAALTESAPTQSVQAAAPARQLPAAATIQRATVPPATSAQRVSPAAPTQQATPATPSQLVTPCAPSDWTHTQPGPSGEPPQQAPPAATTQQVPLAAPRQREPPGSPTQQLPPATPTHQVPPATLTHQVPPATPIQPAPVEPSQRIPQAAPTQQVSPVAPSQQASVAPSQRVPSSTSSQPAPPAAPTHQVPYAMASQRVPLATVSKRATQAAPTKRTAPAARSQRIPPFTSTQGVAPIAPTQRGRDATATQQSLPATPVHQVPPGTRAQPEPAALITQKAPPTQQVPPASPTTGKLAAVPALPTTSTQPAPPAAPSQEARQATPTQRIPPAGPTQRGPRPATPTHRVPTAAKSQPTPPATQTQLDSPDISAHEDATTQQIPPAPPSHSPPLAMARQEIPPATRQHSAAAILPAALLVQEALHATPPREVQPPSQQSIAWASAPSSSSHSVSHAASLQAVRALHQEDHPAATTKISSTTSSQQKRTCPHNLLPTPEQQISPPASTPSQTASHCSQVIQPRIESSFQAHATALARGRLASSEWSPLSEEQLMGPREARTSAWSFQLATNSCLNTGPQKLLLTPDESALLTQLRRSVKPYWPDFSSLWLDFNQMPRVKLTMRPSTTCTTSRSCSPPIDSMNCSAYAASTAREQDSHSSLIETSSLIDEDSTTCWDSSETVHLWREDLSVFDHVEWQPIISQLREATLDVDTAYHKVAKVGVRQMLLHAPDGSSWWLRQAGTGAVGTIIRESGTMGKYRTHRSWRSTRAALVAEIRPGMCCFILKEAADGSLMLRAPSGKVLAAPAHIRKPTADANHEVGVGSVSGSPSSSRLVEAPPPSSLLLVDKSPYTMLMEDSTSSSQLVEDTRSSSLLWEDQSHYPMQVSEVSSSSQLVEPPAQLLLEDHRQYPQPMEDDISSLQDVERPIPSSLLLVDKSTGSMHMDAPLSMCTHGIEGLPPEEYRPQQPMLEEGPPPTSPPVEDSPPDAMLVEQVPPPSPSSRARQARVLRLMKQLQRSDNSIKLSAERSEMLRVSSSSDPPTSSNVPPAQLSRHESTTSSHVAAESISQAETQTWPRQCPEPAEHAASSAHTTSCLVDSSSSSAAAGRADEASFSMQQRRAVGNTTVTRAGVVGEKSLSTERDRPSTLGGGVKATCAEVPEQQMPPLPRNAAEQTEPALGPGAEKTVALSNCTEGWIRWHRPQATTPPGAQREPLGVTITPAAEKPRRNTRQAARLPVGRTAKAAAKAASEGKSQIFPGDQSLPEEQRSVCSDATELSSTAHPELMALLQFADEMDLTDILQCC